jgi:hypothetical protein
MTTSERLDLRIMRLLEKRWRVGHLPQSDETGEPLGSKSRWLSR